MVCEKVSLCGEQVVLCLENQIWQHNRAAETAQEVAGQPAVLLTLLGTCNFKACPKTQNPSSVDRIIYNRASLKSKPGHLSRNQDSNRDTLSSNDILRTPPPETETLSPVVIVVVYCCCEGVFRLGLRKIVHLRRECEELKRYLKELQLAERNIDATSSGLPALQVYIQYYILTYTIIY